MGVNTDPDTTVGTSRSPEEDQYSTLAARRLPASSRRVTPGIVVADTNDPGPVAVISAVSTGVGAPTAEAKLFANSKPRGRTNGDSARMTSN